MSRTKKTNLQNPLLYSFIIALTVILCMRTEALCVFSKLKQSYN